MKALQNNQMVEWRISVGLTPYENALREMEQRVTHLLTSSSILELIWLLEHPSLYTTGTSARTEDLIHPLFPVYPTGRGGQVTYHGPGQRIVYVLLDLKRRQPDIRAFICGLEQWIIETLALFGVQGLVHPDRIGVWIPRPDKPKGLQGEIAEDKIAAIGLRLRRWVSFHGFAINRCLDLTPFQNIVPCGIRASHLGVTSLADLGLSVSSADLDQALARSFTKIFGSPLQL